jgi:hypothetical protein
MPAQSDDPIGIPDDTRLFRRIDPNQVVFDANRNERRPTSQNFQDSKDGTPMSVFLENVAIAHGESPSDFLRGRWVGWYLVAVRAGAMRRHGQEVFLDPQNQDADDRYLSHAAVRGSNDKKTRPRLAQEYEWVVAPPNRYEPAE